MTLRFAVFLALTTVALASRCPRYELIVVRGVSGNAKGLTKSVNRFRFVLGGKNNGNEVGPFPRGRREINWDAAAVPFNMPFDFFNTNVPRGALFSAKGNKFAVSNSVDPKDNRFSSLNRRASRGFNTFSPKRLFTPVRRNTVTAFFRIPGRKTPAAVSGFGAVFVDVRKKRTSFLTLRDRRGCPIAKVAVPPRKRGLSFVGVFVKGIRTQRGLRKVKAPVKLAVMKLGDTPIVSKNNYRNPDFVVLDDLLYGEPQL